MERCVQLISSTDFTEKLKTLESESSLRITCLHGDKDSPESQVVMLKKIVPRTVVKIYENAAHGKSLSSFFFFFFFFLGGGGYLLTFFD